ASKAFQYSNSGYWLAIHPKKLQLPDLLGIEPIKRRKGKADATTLCADFRRLAQTIRGQLDERESPGGSLPRATISRAKMILDSVRDTLGRLESGAELIYQVEEARTLSLSMELAQRHQFEPKDESTFYSYKYINYIKLLDSLLSTLES